MSKPSKVLVIGSGPIIIGQAAEFDYSGTQACRALREEGVTSVLVNSNPATIMTDEGIADIIYIEPLTVEIMERIIARERPDGLLPTIGGQTGLNLAVEIAEAGILDKYNVRPLGTSIDTIRTAEDRELFKQLLLDIGEPVPDSATVNTLDEAREVARRIGLPLVIRPGYTLGGTGGGIAKKWEELEQIVSSGLAASRIHQVLVEKCLTGWKEIEFEVMRDGADNCITICCMENIDPMGVHTGDSIVVAPSQTLNDKEYQMLRSASIKIIRALGIEGGCNIQFALKPHPIIESREGKEDPYYVIEVNPRVSRSSALASKATGYPIARVSAKIAVGRRLDEIANKVTGKTTAAFEPTLDYCVVKMPRWPFDKFALGDRTLGTQMKSTGEAMAIGRSFEEALQKAVRSLEIGGKSLLWEDRRWKDGHYYPLEPNDLRLWALMASLRRGASIEDLCRRTGIDPWFMEKFQNIVDMEKLLLSEKLTPELLREAKRLGFSDEQIGTLADRLPEQVRELRRNWKICPVYKMVDTCAAEFAAETPYFYSTYEKENEAEPLCGRKAVVIGSGPIRIGQGIEFDYCSVHSAWALREAGVKSIMVNSNPETVSTDFDTSDRLYFEPLDEESLRDILENETNDGPRGGSPPSIVQFGGQTAINLAQPLDRANLPIWGIDWGVIQATEDRKKFERFLELSGIPQIPGGSVMSVKDGLRLASMIGYPVVVRPSFVLGGLAMEVLYGPSELEGYVESALDAVAKVQLYAQDGRLKSRTEAQAVYLSKFIEGVEAEVDALCDGKRVLIPGIMEHIERAGVHSGDSVAVFPSTRLEEEEKRKIEQITLKIAKHLDTKGLLNIQFIVERGQNANSTVYVIEVNPRASRTIPFISKATGIPLARIATRIVAGATLDQLGFKDAPDGLWDVRTSYAVKAPVFSMAKLRGVDTYLGPQMRSTGEVMGIDRSLEDALSKALLSAGLVIPKSGGILLSIADRDKNDAIKIIKEIGKSDLQIYATPGTALLIRGLGFKVNEVKRLEDGHPNGLDLIAEGRIHCLVNTPGSAQPGALRDGFEIRRAAVERGIPCFTSVDTAVAALRASSRTPTNFSVEPLGLYTRYSGLLITAARKHRAIKQNAERLIQLAGLANELGWPLYATDGTAEFLKKHKIKVALIADKIGGKGPTVNNLLHQKYLRLVIDIPDPSKPNSLIDAKKIRYMARKDNIRAFSSPASAFRYMRSMLQLQGSGMTQQGLLLTVADVAKTADLIRLAKLAVELKYPIYATRGTSKFLQTKGGLSVNFVVPKIGSYANSLQTIISEGFVTAVVNVPQPSNTRSLNHYKKIEQLARKQSVPIFSSVLSAIAYFERLQSLGVGEGCSK